MMVVRISVMVQQKESVRYSYDPALRARLNIMAAMHAGQKVNILFATGRLTVCFADFKTTAFYTSWLKYAIWEGMRIEER